MDREWDLSSGLCSGYVSFLEGGLAHGAMLVEAVLWVSGGVPMVAMNMVSLRWGKLQL
jgi:hypothetical protein